MSQKRTFDIRAEICISTSSQQKTKKAVTIGIIAPHVIDIIENSFPYKIHTQKLNLYIKEVCKIAKIEPHLQRAKYLMQKQDVKS